MNLTVEIFITFPVKVIVSSKTVGTASAAFRTDATLELLLYTLRSDSDSFDA